MLRAIARSPCLESLRPTACSPCLESLRPTACSNVSLRFSSKALRPLVARTITNSIRFSSTTSTTETIPEHVQHDLNIIRQKTKKLPLSCPGCGAPSQVVAAEEAGFYTLTRSAVKKFVSIDVVKEEDRIFDDTVKSVDSKVLQELGLDNKNASDQEQQQPTQTPICDRCHNLLHHHTGVSIYHPSVDSIRDIIQESPHKHNHIYHILDASDFPMSLIPNLLHRLDLPALRTQNRRSKHRRYVNDRVAEVSFIITRSDLLAPNKEQVDSLMPYLRETLRDALGRTAKNVRLGNLRCVSAKRGWWTKNVKEDIWDRGGAAWMVGKVNVGKSNLFEVVFPKGRGKLPAAEPTPMSVTLKPDVPAATDDAADTSLEAENTEATGEISMDASSEETRPTPTQQTPAPEEPDFFDVEEGSLLPPAQIETQFPVMPVISSLPGTTASPIRVPFGDGKGELIDLPGIARSNLEEFVIPDHRQDLVMRSRVVPEQLTIKPGQSLLLGGGLIRITPTTPDLVFLSYSFLPLHPHITSTEKAVAVASGERTTGLSTIMTEAARKEMASAGVFRLQWDVTKQRAGPLTSKSAAKLKPDQLPFKVYSTDILIEGVGWVELVAQMRRSMRKRPISTLLSDEFSDTSIPLPDDSDMTTYKPFGGSLAQQSEQPQQRDLPTVPEVEVFSPKGKFVGARPPMSAWLLGGKKAPSANDRKSRPRLSMKSYKSTQRGREAQNEG